MQKFTLKMPDDWHSHLRNGTYLTRTVPDTCRFFNRAIVMPNLASPITTVAAAQQYRTDILAQVPHGQTFEPLMTLYLTDDMPAAEITLAKESGVITALKLYPKGATTHSAHGVTDITKLYPVLDAMQQHQLPLLIHGEVADNSDIFDREKNFIHATLPQLLKDFPQLKIVLEHISTRDAVNFVAAGPANLAATITAHHLLLNRKDILAGGIKPHHYCLPIAKREEDRQALIAAATSGSAKFFLGTDSAPHARHLKENACGCAGIYTALHAIPLYLEVFDAANALHQFERFASINGPAFYGLPLNTTEITFVKHPWQVPETLSFGDTEVIPLFAGKTLQWQLTL